MDSQSRQAFSPEAYRVQRQLYPILLLIAGSAAVAVCLRPQMAEELTSLVRNLGLDLPKQAFAEAPSGLGYPDSLSMARGPAPMPPATTYPSVSRPPVYQPDTAMPLAQRIDPRTPPVNWYPEAGANELSRNRAATGQPGNSRGSGIPRPETGLLYPEAGGGSLGAGETLVSDANSRSPARRLAADRFSAQPPTAQPRARFPEDPLAGFANANDRTMGYEARRDTQVVQPARMGQYPVAGQQHPSADLQYPSAGNMNYPPPAETGRPLPGNRQPGIPDDAESKYAELRPECRPPAESYSLRDRAPAYQPPQPSFQARREDFQTRTEPPRPVVEAPAAAAEPSEGLCETAQILARVGSDVILAGEVLPLVDNAMEENKDKIPENQWDATRQALIKQAIDGRIQAKVICADIKRKLPPEGLAHISGIYGDGFETHEIPARLKKANLASRLELERELEKIGSSLKREKQIFVERAMAMKWRDENISDTGEITHDDMLDYYREHQEGYEHAARARWEQVSVLFSKHPDKAQAFDAIARMGNAVLDGRPLADVAREHSEGITAKSGGARDWTTQGSLRSKELDQAIFGLPVGKLSQIIEDQEGFHVIRVAEREDRSRTPFVEAQVEIKKKLAAERKKQQLDEFIGRLEKEIPVWTIFDEQTADTRSSEPGKPPIR